MIKLIVNNAKFKFAIALFLFLPVFSVLIKKEGFTPIEAVRVVLGGYSLGKPILITTFAVYITVLQYINIDAINYLLIDNKYLLVRYHDWRILFKKLLSAIIVLNILLMSVILIATNLSIILTNFTYQFSLFETIEVFIRGLLSGIFCSVLQILFIVEFDETNTFMIMIGLTVVYSFFSILNLSVISVFPYELSGFLLAINIIISCLYTVFLILISNKIYKCKGMIE